MATWAWFVIGFGTGFVVGVPAGWFAIALLAAHWVRNHP